MATKAKPARRSRTVEVRRESSAGGLRIEIDHEVDGRWIADVVDLPGVMVYGDDRASAIRKAKELAIRVIEERKQRGEPAPDPVFIEE